MKSSYTEYLRTLEGLAAQSSKDDLYLWPRTPMGYDHQEKILERVGVSDYDLDNPSSRPALIIRQIQTLIRRGLVSEDFSLLDIACGDAIVLWQIKKAFPLAQCYGVDCNKNRFGTHGMVQREGVGLFNAFIQHLFAGDSPAPFDLALMLNTYRGWESADLRDHECRLPELADTWFERNARYTILTATDRQIARLRRLNLVVTKIGRGEDDSTMICFSRSRLPGAFWRRALCLGFDAISREQRSRAPR